MKQETIKALSRLLYVYVAITIYVDLAFYLSYYGAALPLGSMAPDFPALFVSTAVRVVLSGLGLVGLTYLRRQRHNMLRASATGKMLGAA